MENNTSQIETAETVSGIITTIGGELIRKNVIANATWEVVANHATFTTSLGDLIDKINDGTANGYEIADVALNLAGIVAGAAVIAGAAPEILLALTAVAVAKEVLQYADEHNFDTTVIKADVFEKLNVLNGILNETSDWWADYFNGINSDVNDLWNAAQNWAFPRDPLILDLDGDGIETLAINATSNVVFDYDGDGLKTGTGWIKGDDGFVVLDRNGNGTIDNGGELFGDQTLVNGVKAADGFAALSGEDSNSDGVFDARDSSFTAVRIWQDTNSDGISQADELHTMSELGITSINLTSTTSNTVSNGNVQIAKGTYTKTNGTTGDSGTLGLLDEAGIAGNLSRHSVLRHGIQCLRWIPYQVRDEKVNCEARETTLGCEIVNNQNFRNTRRVA